jgi:hypothetical protein
MSSRRYLVAALLAGVLAQGPLRKACVQALRPSETPAAAEGQPAVRLVVPAPPAQAEPTPKGASFEERLASARRVRNIGVTATVSGGVLLTAMFVLAIKASSSRIYNTACLPLAVPSGCSDGGSSSPSTGYAISAAATGIVGTISLGIGIPLIVSGARQMSELKEGAPRGFTAALAPTTGGLLATATWRF